YYLWRMFVPLRLSVDPDPAILASPVAAGFVLSTLVLLILAASTLWLSARDRLLAAGIVLLLMSSLAAYCLFPVADVVAESRLYITVLGAVIILAGVIVKLRHGVIVAAV